MLYPIAIVIYILIGAAVFTAIELGPEKDRRLMAESEKQEVLENIMNQFDLSENEAMEIFNNFTYLCNNNDLQALQGPYEWDFVQSFFFSATVVTAIGMVYIISIWIATWLTLCVYRL